MQQLTQIDINSFLIVVGLFLFAIIFIIYRLATGHASEDWRSPRQAAEHFGFLSSDEGKEEEE